MGQIINPGMASGGSFDENGTYPNMTVGNATHAVSADSATNAGHATTADSATNATNATSADSATKATQDGNGNNIASTYATKDEMPKTIYAGTLASSTVSTYAIYFFSTLQVQNAVALASNLYSRGYRDVDEAYPASGYWEGNIIVGLYAKSAGVTSRTLYAYGISGATPTPLEIPINDEETKNIVWHSLLS